MKVEDVMTKAVITVGPDAPLKQVAELLTAHRVSGVPVVDEHGVVAGVISEGDIVGKEAGLPESRSWLARLRGSTDAPTARTAGEAMSSPPVTIGPHRDVSEAARLMVERSVNRLPVVDGGRLVGIVARADLVRAFVRSDEEIERELREDVLESTLWLDSRSLTLSVEQGTVTLAGELGTKADVELAERFAARVPGVIEVRSHLRWRIDEPRIPTGDPHVPPPPPRTR